MKRLALIVMFACVAVASRADNVPGSPVSVDSLPPPVSLTGRLTGAFNNADVIIGNVANTSVYNAQTKYAELTGLTIVASPALTNLPSGYYLDLDSTNINAAAAILFASTGGWGTTVWAISGVVKQGTAGSFGPGMTSRSANIYPGMAFYEESNKPICFGTNDTERACWLAGGGLSFDESTGVTSASHSVLYDDSTSHRLLLSNNADAFDTVARTSSVIASADITNATATPSVVTTVTLAAAGSYACEAQGVLSESTAADGFQVVSALATGTATKASVSGELYDAAGLHANGEASSTALTLADTNASTGHYVIHYGVVVNAAATWTISTGQQSHSTGTLTTRAGATATCTRTQ